jgi:hypothetical protein
VSDRRVGPDESQATITSMSHDKLSMIASHLATGGVLCCLEGKTWVMTVTGNKAESSAIEYFAHETLGCAQNVIYLPLRKVPMYEAIAKRRAAYYFTKFMELI